jgi:serine/threonine protein kinase, bacterial
MECLSPKIFGIAAGVRRWFRLGARGFGAALLLALLPVLTPPVGAAVAPDNGGDRAVLNGSIKAVPANVPAGATGPHITRTDLRPEELNATMPFNVALKMRNFAELEARLAQGETIDPGEMAARYWPLPEDYAATANWLTQQGFTIGPESGGFMIFVRGTVAQVRDAFQVSFARVANEGAEFTSAISAPSVPAELAPALIGINGLQPHLRKHPMLAHPRSVTTPTGSAYLPSDILAAYGANTLTQTGAGQTIAIVMEAYPKTSDLTKFWTTCNISQSLGNVTFLNVNEGPPSNPSSDDLDEASLDTEWSSSIAPAAKIRFYGVPELDDSDLDAAYSQIYNDATNSTLAFGIHVVSMSFGGSEESEASMATEDQDFAQLASAGVTVFVSSGDDGEGVESPSSDPNVTAVGGTSITLNTNDTVATETAWSDSSGGQSSVYAKPAWQTGTGVPGANPYRMTPDVAAPADPDNGGLIIVNGTMLPIGGTSWGAPTWAGLAARIDQALATNNPPKSLGLLGPKIYPLLDSNCFFDITSDENSENESYIAYPAGIDYDMATGIGRPIFPALLQELTTVVEAPRNVIVAPGEDAFFSPITHGANSFQWQVMAAGTTTWVNLANNGTYSGVTTGVLTVNAVTTAMSGDQFQCIINGDVTTPAATLVVVAPEFYVSTFAGQAGVTGTANGVGTAAQFNIPEEVALDAGGNIFVADSLNNSVRKITPAGNVTTVAGSSTGVAGYANATGTAALFDNVNAVVVGAGGNIYVADSNNNAIRKITPTKTGNSSVEVVTTFAGSAPNNRNLDDAGTEGSRNGTGTGAEFDFPVGVAVDTGGNIYVADTNNNLIRKITPAGNVTTLAGQADVAGYANGNGTSATFNFPCAVAVDADDNVYVADSNNNAIRKITPAGVVTTLAGDPPYQGMADGTGTTARFNFPSGIAVDSGGNLYVADTNNNAIRKITPAGVVTTLAGSPNIAGSADGVGSAATFYQPCGLAVANSGNLYIADTYNNTIRLAQLTSAPSIQTQPVNATVIVGNLAEFSVVATGVPAPTYQWQVLPSGGETWTNLTDDDTYNGSATANLTIADTTPDLDGDQFQCLVSNAVGNITSNIATLTVQEEAPAFTTQPEDETVTVGGATMFSVADDGIPTPTVLWQILINGGSVWANLTDNATYSGSATANLTINATTSAMNGNQFRAIISNNFGNLTSNMVTLTVQSPPAFTMQPTEQDFNAGDNVGFSVAVSGVPAPTLQWQILPSGGSVWTNLADDATYNGSATANLTINAATADMSGDQFQCVASNLLGNVTSNTAVLLLEAPPAITIPPANTTVEVGSNAMFSVTVSGVPAPAYQWQYLPSGGSTWTNLTDNATYSGSATANLTINDTTAAMNGDQFQVISSNAPGNATSTPVTLTVDSPAAFTAPPASALVAAGNSAVFTVAATGVPEMISYQWQILDPGGSTWTNLTDDGVNFTGSNTSTLTVSNTTTAESGSQFQCVAGNGVSSAVTSAAASLYVVPSGYLSWAAALNLAGASALPSAQPFNDTLPNLVRYAMNVGATPAAGDLPALSVQTANNTPYLTLQYNQLIGLTGVQLVAQYSYDLVTWQTLSNGAVVQLADPNQQTEQFSASVAIPANGTVFLRLVVEPAP